MLKWDRRKGKSQQVGEIKENDEEIKNMEMKERNKAAFF
jgi:hypothetical protein